jgi:hypothetical protein
VQNNSTLFVIQTTKGRKNPENMNKSINKREQNGRERTSLPMNFLFSPRQFSLKRKEATKIEN